jgi:preprotein translocase subunit YajC
MKNFKTALLVSASFGLLAFLLFDGVEWLAKNISMQISFLMLILIFSTIFILFVIKMYQSIKWWKESAKYRETLKEGDEVLIHGPNTQYKATVVEINDIKVVVKVHKNSIYKP